MSDLPLHRTMQDDEIDRLKAQLKEAEEKGRVLMGMFRDLKGRVRELDIALLKFMEECEHKENVCGAMGHLKHAY